MRNDRKNKSKNYYIDEFPPNYSGQHTKQNFPSELDFEEPAVATSTLRADVIPTMHDSKEHKAQGHSGILGSLGNIFKQRNSQNSFLSGLFSGKKIKNIFSDLDFEDLILLGVIFFLLRDGAEDDLLVILAIILFTGN